MTSATYEQALEIVRALSPEERKRLLREFEAERHQQAQPTNGGAVEYHHRGREMGWLSEHRREYIGQWVALDGDRLISHNEDLGKVYDEARAQGVQVPFTAFMEDPDQPSMGGW
ncbi:MAG: DUF5678 domain-containing protein [Blastocatellia bacterium]